MRHLRRPEVRQCLPIISTYVQKVFQNKEMWLYIIYHWIFYHLYHPQTGTGSCLEDWDYCGSNCHNVVVTAMGSIDYVNIPPMTKIIGNIAAAVAAVAGLVLNYSCSR